MANSTISSLLSSIALLCLAASVAPSSGRHFEQIPDRWSSHLPDRWTNYNSQRAVHHLPDRWSNDDQVADRWSTSEIPDQDQDSQQIPSTQTPNHTPLQGQSPPYNSAPSTTTPSTPSTTTPSTTTPSTPSTTTQAASDASQGAGRKVWCIGKPSAQDINLIRNLQYACGEGGADCTQIQPGGSCYRPNSLVAHASYAMNMFYQKNGRNWWTCHFNNTGLLVFTDPSFGNCIYQPA